MILKAAKPLQKLQRDERASKHRDCVTMQQRTQERDAVAQRQNCTRSAILGCRRSRILPETLLRHGACGKSSETRWENAVALLMMSDVPRPKILPRTRESPIRLSLLMTVQYTVQVCGPALSCYASYHRSVRKNVHHCGRFSGEKKKGSAAKQYTCASETCVLCT